MTPRRAQQIYGGLIGLLALGLVVEWLPGAASPALPVAQAVKIAHESLHLPLKQTAAWSATVLRRPLFSMSRQAPKGAASHVVADSGDGKLVGIMISGRRRSAIFALEGGHARAVTVGDTLGDNTVRAIEPGRVWMHPPAGRDFAVNLQFGKSTAQPGGPAPYQPPMFPQANFPTPPIIPQPTLLQPQQAGGDDAGDGNDSGPPPQPVTVPGLPVPFPGFRGPVPPRRE